MRDRRLADSAFAGADADNIADLCESALRQGATAKLALQFALLGIAENIEADAYAGDAIERPNGLSDCVFEVAADRATGGRQRDDNSHFAVVGLLDRANHSEFND